jgi:hypothetical protein
LRECTSKSSKCDCEDNVNENILYLGTDNGLYVSLNKVQSWEDFSNGMPNVAVHDVVIQKKAKDLVVGTHGRSFIKSIWIK